jgi:hypothetical protein
MRKDSISITLLPGTDTLVIRKGEDSRVFILTNDSIIISKDTLVVLLKYMMKNNLINPKILEGLLEEVHTE